MCLTLFFTISNLRADIAGTCSILRLKTLQFRTIEDFVERNNLYLNRNIIVSGDINLNLFEPSVYSHHYNRFKSFLCKLNLIDVAVKANSHSIPTWRGFGERAASKSCIDVFFCSKDNPRLNFVNYTVHASSSSDHMILNLAVGENRTHANPSSDPRTIPWKDNIITSRAFKIEAQEALIALLSARILNPSLINLTMFNDENTSLHRKLGLLDKPDNIEMQENDLTYLLPLILKKWKAIHDSIFLEYSLKSVKYKHDTFQKSFSSICKKIDFSPGALGPKEELKKLRNQRQEDIVVTKANIKRELKIKNLMSIGKASAWSFSSLKIKEDKKTLRLFNENTEIEDSDEILSTLAGFHANKTSLGATEWSFKTSKISDLLNQVHSIAILKDADTDDLNEDDLLEHLNFSQDERADDTPIPESGKLASGLEF